MMLSRCNNAVVGWSLLVFGLVMGLVLWALERRASAAGAPTAQRPQHQVA